MLWKHLQISLYTGLFGNRRLAIPPGALVLEVGGGDHPYYRSNVLCEKFVHDPAERGGSVVIDRPFVVGDAENLPFQDQAFDYCVCRHVVEHLRHPEKCFSEMARVARAGYIETPSALAEKTFGWPYHLWEIGLRDGVLELQAKKNPGQPSVSGSYFHEWARVDRGLQDLMYDRRKDFYVMLEWQGRIAYKISGKAKIGSASKARLQPMTEIRRRSEELPPTLRNRVVLKLKQWLTRRHLRKDLEDIAKLALLLRCPHCGHEELSLRTDTLSCPSCRHRYTIKNGVPVLLV